MKTILSLLLIVMAADAAQADQVCGMLRGAIILAQDDGNTMLGKVEGRFDSDSIFSQFGTYGSKFSSSSVWNEFSAFGSPYGFYSANNPSSTSPPMLIKNGAVVGYLSANKSIRASISPSLLKALCEGSL